MEVAVPTKPYAFALDCIRTPIGTVLVAVDSDARLRALEWVEHRERMERRLRLHYGADGVRLEGRPAHAAVRTALDRYFADDVTALDALAVATAGTPFQRDVWSALRRIPAGTTVSYGVLAARIGRPRAVRAVGSAVGANPIGVVVPCHRVIGADSALAGYAGGIERKRWLLIHEGAGGAGGDASQSDVGKSRIVRMATIST
jgi:methylated-DNA-[protein]-cysteine S-methyltransferase